jgi:hypothetical protein
MFRIGGSANEGIVSMAQPRKNYQEGSDYQKRIEELRPILQQAAGMGRSERDRFLDMLLQGSIRLASERPAGNIFSTAARAFQQPVDQYLKSGADEEAFQRQINLTAATQGISSVEAERLQKMKVEAAQAEAIQRAQQADKELFLKTSQLGPNAGSIYETKRALEKKGEVVTGAVSTVTAGEGKVPKPVPSAILSIPEGRVFYDVNGNFYRKVSKDQSKEGWKRINLSGEEIKGEAIVKPTGFFGEVKEKGAAYDPRSWNKQKFYESLAKKNPPSTME